MVHKSSVRVTSYTACSPLVPEYDVTRPFQADADGNFLSYNLNEHARQRRDTNEQNLQYYKIEAFGMSLHLNLSKNDDVIVPGLLVETLHNNESKKYSDPPTTTFYSGHVTSDPHSVVALSKRNGLVSQNIPSTDKFDVNNITKLCKVFWQSQHGG